MRSLCALSGAWLQVPGTLVSFINHLLVFCQRFGGQGLRASASAQRDTGRDSACWIVQITLFSLWPTRSLKPLLYNRHKPTRYVCTPPTIYLVLCRYKATVPRLRRTSTIPVLYQYKPYIPRSTNFSSGHAICYVAPTYEAM